MKEARTLSLFTERLQFLSERRAFVKLALCYYGSQYRMGSEGFVKCDCSGLVCSALRGLGYKIRVNANDIMNNFGNIFPYEINSMIDGDLVGFKDSTGKFKHVGIVLKGQGEPTFLHASHPRGVRIEALSEVVKRYIGRGKQPVALSLDMTKVRELDGTEYGLDEEWL